MKFQDPAWLSLSSHWGPVCSVLLSSWDKGTKLGSCFPTCIRLCLGDTRLIHDSIGVEIPASTRTHIHSIIPTSLPAWAEHILYSSFHLSIFKTGGRVNKGGIFFFFTNIFSVFTTTLGVSKNSLADRKIKTQRLSYLPKITWLRRGSWESKC